MSSVVSKVFWVTKFNLPKRERNEMKPKPTNPIFQSMRTHKAKKSSTPFSDITTIPDMSVANYSESKLQFEEE